MFFLSFVLMTTASFVVGAFNDYHSDKILLSDVRAITLHKGQMTNARRSSPVPQLKCVGGTAQYKFTPKVVQCTNQGSDGYDIQWECKADMDNAYRFGHVEVSCEGYDYPNDPFVLKGSCGLEYTIDFTEEGLRREKKSNSYGYQSNYYNKSEGGLGGLFVFAGILFAIYVIYKTCIAPQAQGHQRNQFGSAEPSAPPQPPPYGFRPEFTSSQGAPPPPSYESCNPGGPSSHFGQSSNRADGGGAGFWTGAATGGMLGYLFGQGNNRGRSWGSGWNSGYQPSHHYESSPRSSFFSSPSSSDSSSSGTRTAMGFAKTSRR